MRVLDLFSGIGGFSLGLERAGMKTKAFCEIEPYPRKVLAKHWPGVPIYDDVRRIDYSGAVDLVTAGFPCQDISFAGQGAGLSGERSGLYWYILRTLRMVGRPKLMLENVAALLSRGMGSVLGSLAQIGYDSEWHCIPASSIGAPHHWDRCWIVADDWSKRGQRSFPHKIQRLPAFSWCKNGRGITELPDRSDLYESKLCGGGNGVSKRLDATGNAVMPQIVELIGRAILETEASRL